MQVPIRKAGQYTNMKLDPNMTKNKFDELIAQLKKLKDLSQPRAVAEVKRLALMGDFSENHAYQMAKGKLRGINQRILDLEKLLAEAVIIENKKSSTVVMGSIVTLEFDGQKKIFQILGSLETAPAEGIISYSSPLAQIILGKKVGDTAELKTDKKTTSYKILKID